MSVHTSSNHIPSSRALRRAALAVVGTALLLGTCAGLQAGGGGADDRSANASTEAGTASSGPGGASGDGEVAAGALPDAELDDATEDANDATDDSVGYPGGGGDQLPDAGNGGSGGELDPVGPDVASSAACQDLLASGAVVLVSPDPKVLPSGSMSSTLTLTNCGGEAVGWTAQTVPTVALADDSGDLAPGSSAELAFTIDADAYEPGAVNFKIKVSEPGRNHYVDVHAFRELVGSDMAGDFGLTAGPDAGGCANQCIVSALLSANLTSPNVTLEVGTNTPAVMNVYVSESAPDEEDGHPVFPGVDPVATSGFATTHWTTPVSPLEADTKYNIIVEATDGNANTSYRSGSFTTITPVDLPDGFASPDGPAGCAAQCITIALVSPQGADMAVHVESHTSAIFDVYVSEEAPTYAGNVPSFDGSDSEPVASSDPLDLEEWDTVLEDLLADTDYHIIVRATDLHGGRSYRVGTFTTPEGPQYLVRFQAIEVIGDGDSGDLNRGELSFAWGFDDFTMGTRAEEKIHSGTTVQLGEADTAFIATDGGGFLPMLYVSGSERDADGLVEFCSQGTGVAHEPGQNDDCDAKWNVASSGFYSGDSIDALPSCAGFDVADEFASARCMTFETADLGDDYPRFSVIVSFESLG
jgi:hypothetical protein